ncbi:MAG: hypothetical protein ACXVI0_11235 [Halobacteriota archaeon]
MKRTTLIAVALCLILITTVGAGVVSAKPETTASQKGASLVYQCAVTNNGKIVGKLIINAASKTPTYTFVGHGLKANTRHILQYTTASGTHTVGVAITNKAGVLAIHGTFTVVPNDMQAAKFSVTERLLGDVPPHIRGSATEVLYVRFEGGKLIGRDVLVNGRLEGSYDGVTWAGIPNARIKAQPIWDTPDVTFYADADGNFNADLPAYYYQDQQYYLLYMSDDGSEQLYSITYDWHVVIIS